MGSLQIKLVKVRFHWSRAGPKSGMTGVLRKGGNLDTDRGNTAMCREIRVRLPQAKGGWKRKEGPSPAVFRGAWPYTCISDFWPQTVTHSLSIVLSHPGCGALYCSPRTPGDVHTHKRTRTIRKVCYPWESPSVQALCHDCQSETFYFIVF